MSPNNLSEIKRDKGHSARKPFKVTAGSQTMMSKVPRVKDVMTVVAKFAGSRQIILSLPVLRAGKVGGIIARQDFIQTFFKMTAKIPDAQTAILDISGLEKRRREIEKLR